MRVILRVPGLRDLPARMMAFGLRRVRLERSQEIRWFDLQLPATDSFLETRSQKQVPEILEVSHPRYDRNTPEESRQIFQDMVGIRAPRNNMHAVQQQFKGNPSL